MCVQSFPAFGHRTQTPPNKRVCKVTAYAYTYRKNMQNCEVRAPFFNGSVPNFPVVQTGSLCLKKVDQGNSCMCTLYNFVMARSIEMFRFGSHSLILGYLKDSNTAAHSADSDIF